MSCLFKIHLCQHIAKLWVGRSVSSFVFPAPHCLIQWSVHRGWVRWINTWKEGFLNDCMTFFTKLQDLRAEIKFLALEKNLLKMFKYPLPKCNTCTFQIILTNEHYRHCPRAGRSPSMCGPGLCMETSSSLQPWLREDLYSSQSCWGPWPSPHLRSGRQWGNSTLTKMWV